ncbi:hypothetical protein FHS31_000542 [Sphingomonas vulcanisoli]|uniref:Uncharacterized protein n=1 Tax=Sphingomonas vulcanisoli TaxID=1658060 RepID=A0ABX0TRY6_9SPHN|nr:hypothetical protein [Sphingomonas vulcanisoli]NIJ06960.1 hypothetical protein [Sphingomonas vulcanisoli]
MMQAFATLAFTAIAIGAVLLIARVLAQDWHAVVGALGFGKAPSEFTPLPPRYRVNSRRATYVRMEATPLRRAA